MRDTSKEVKKPKKKRKIDQEQPEFELRSEDDLRQASRRATLRQDKAKKIEHFSNAKEVTDQQMMKLSELLGHPPASQYCGFVCWANGYYFGTPYTLNKWGKGLYISRVYWIRAIEMALNGSNDLFSAADLIAMSFGFEDDFDMLRQELEV